jgi:hypothetical protein
MVVNLGLCSRRPDEDLQRVAIVLASIAMCHIPVSRSVSRFFQEGANLTFEKAGVIYKSDQERSGLL